MKKIKQLESRFILFQKLFFSIFIISLFTQKIYSQNFYGNINLYGFKYQETNIYPSLTVNLNRESKRTDLYSELRVNYEDLNLYSALIGLNYFLDKDSNITITPYAGLTFGNFSSIPVGFNFIAETPKFDFYSQQQVNNRINKNDTGFYFSWSEINFKFIRKPKITTFVGLTSVIDVSIDYSDFSSGLKTGISVFDKIEASFYLFNINKPSFFISLMYEF